MKRLRFGICFMITLVAVSAVGSQSFAQTNMLVNPGFEDGGGSYNGWFTFGSGPQISTSATDNIMRTGLAAAKIYGEFTGCPDSPQFDVGGFGQDFTPTVGWIYTLSGYSYVSSADPIPGTDTCNRNRLIAKVVFFDSPSGGLEVSSNEIVIGDGNTPMEQWREFTVSAPAPAGALRVEALFLFLQPACDTGSVFVDDCSFVEAEPPAPEPNLLVNPSFDGGLSGWTTFANVFPEGRSYLIRTPTGSAKMFGPFTTPGDVSGMYQKFPATPYSDYQLDVYSLVTCRESPINESNDNFATAKIVFLDSGGAEVGAEEMVIADSTSSLGLWTHYSMIGHAHRLTDSVAVYLLFVQPTDQGGAVWVDDVSFREVQLTDVPDGSVPFAFALHQNSPNPFNPITTIRFDLPHAVHVKLDVYNVKGERVSTIVDRYMTEGRKEVIWTAQDDRGRAVTSGIYFYRLVAGDFAETKKMVLLK
jgi:hypothetical protein